MKGIIIETIKNAIIENFGQQKWDNIFKQLNINHFLPILKTKNYSEELFQQLIDISTKELNISTEALLNISAEYFIFKTMPQQYKYITDEIRSSKDLLQQLDEIHNFLSSDTQTNPPHFFYKELSDNEAIIEYSSERNLFPFFLKLLEAVRKKYQDFDYEIIEQNKVKIFYKK